MYEWLVAHLPRGVANLVAVVWYAALLALIYALWTAPQAAFRYVQL